MKYLIGLLLLFCLATGWGEECPFCNNEIMQKQAVYESCFWRVLLTHKPAEYGHLLIIPIAHRLTRHELTQAEHNDLYLVEEKIHRVFTSLFGDVIEDLQFEKNGAILQSVNHFHIHVIPIDSNYKTFWKKLEFAIKLFIPPSKLSDQKLNEEQTLFKLKFQAADNSLE